MSEITYSRESDWKHLQPATQGISHRITTSSRRPGKAIEGNVHYRIAAVSPCPDCGGLCFETATGYPHGVRWVEEGARWLKRDCVGREVP